MAHQSAGDVLTAGSHQAQDTSEMHIEEWVYHSVKRAYSSGCFMYTLLVDGAVGAFVDFDKLCHSQLFQLPLKTQRCGGSKNLDIIFFQGIKDKKSNVGFSSGDQDS